MTLEQFKALEPGDMIRHVIDGKALIVHENNGGCVKAIRLVDASNPAEWELVGFDEKDSGPEFPSRECAAPGCKEVISTRFTMCSKHWGMVPQGIKNGIFISARAMKRKEPGAEQNYRDFCRSAIDKVVLHEMGVTED